MFMHQSFSPAHSHSQSHSQTLSMHQVQSMNFLQMGQTESLEMVLEEMENNCALEWVGTDVMHFSGAIRESHSSNEYGERLWEALADNDKSLEEHLVEQLQLCSLSDAEMRSALAIVAFLDHEGYLRASLGEVAEYAGMSVSSVEDALRLVQRLEPTGIAARNLCECLLLQALEEDGEEALSVRFLRESSESIECRDWNAIAKRFGVTVERVQKEIRSLSRFDPAPGRRFEDMPDYVHPDVVIEYFESQQLRIRLNDAAFPSFRVVESFKKNKDLKFSREIKDLCDRAKSLVNFADQRRRLILIVVEQVVQMQAEFFEHGWELLRPLQYQDVANAIGIAQSTVWRAVQNKYADTPWGLLPLKDFFSERIETLDGKGLAVKAVKERIRRLIKEESSFKPLSDQE